MIAKRVYVGKYAGSRSMDRPRKKWTDTVKKRGLDLSGSKENCVWRGFVRGNALGVAQGMNP